jgi:hypothetical protein
VIYLFNTKLPEEKQKTAFQGKGRADFGFLPRESGDRIFLDFFFLRAVDGDGVSHGIGRAVVEEEINRVLG